MQNFKQPGKVLTLTAPLGGVKSGEGVQVGQLFVVATTDANQGQPFEGIAEGVFELNKVAAQAWTEGQLIYWHPTNGATSVAASDLLLIGCAARAAANPSASGEVRLNGIALPGHVAE